MGQIKNIKLHIVTDIKVIYSSLKTMVRNKEANVNYTHIFDTPLTNHITCNVFLEVLKFILFTRYQIPFPLVTLKQQYAREKVKNTATTSIVNVNTKSYRTWCKLASFVENFARISESMGEIVERFSVRKVIMILGSTVVSPKETFVVV